MLPSSPEAPEPEASGCWATVERGNSALPLPEIREWARFRPQLERLVNGITPVVSSAPWTDQCAPAAI
jgi:hypothetical protein